LLAFFKISAGDQCDPRIASRLSRSSFRISPWTCRLVRWKSVMPGAVGSLKQPIADIEAIASPIDP
jgi:hypothetical protein